MAKHAGSGPCIRFVDERSLIEVSVVGKRRLRKNRPSGFVLEPNCVESSSEGSSEDDEVDCSSELEIESDEAETETQGSCSSGEISEDEGSKSKRPSKVTTTNRKSRASTSKPRTRARKAENILTEDKVVVCKLTGQTRLPLVA